MDENKRERWQPFGGMLLVFLILGISGIAFFFWRYDDVFPAASIDLKLSKTEIAARAQKFANEVGYRTEGTVQTTTFYEENNASTFLEYEYDMREANNLMKNVIPCWLWYTRFCRQMELEECKVWLTPDGRLDSFSLEIERERAMPSLSHEQALVLALRFIEDKAGVDIAKTIPSLNTGASHASDGRSSKNPALDVGTKNKSDIANSTTGSDESKLDSSPKVKADSTKVDTQKERASSSSENANAVASVFGPGPIDMNASVPASDLILSSGVELNPGMKVVRDGSVRQAARTDHYFTFEDEKRDFKGGKIRYSAYVSGDRVTEFNSELHVPEAFSHKYRQIRSYNELLKSISSVLFSIVSAGTVFAFIWALSSGRLRWRLIFFSAIGAFVLEFLDYWNYLPSVLQQYDTSKTFQGFLGQQILSSIMSCLRSAFFAAIVIGGIEAVYRTKFPKMIAVENYLSMRGLSNKTVLDSIYAGICIFGLHLGYVAAYYLVGQSMGMWSPLEVREVATLSSVVPAYSAFGVGVNASISEELLYRVFCFVLAQIVFKNFWIANFIQAVGWAFMHSDYPQEPAYARGLELTIVGLFYGWIFKRFGVVTGIISHFVYDAFLGVTSLILSGSPWLVFSSFIACAPPFVLLALGLIKRRSSVPPTDEQLANENYIAVLPPPPVEPNEVHLEQRPLSPGFRWLTIVLCLIGFTTAAFVQPDLIGSWAKVTASKPQAEELARRFLIEQGIVETDWKSVATLVKNMDDEEVQYGYEKEGYNKIRNAVKTAREPVLWWVRLFKPQQKREYAVVLSGSGRPLALSIEEDEDAPGAAPSKEEARAMVDKFLSRYRPELQPLEFESITEQKRKGRTDYIVSYEAPQLKLGDAKFKVSVSTLGKNVSFTQLRWDIPESWKFEREKQNWKDYVSKGAVGILALVIFSLGIFWVVGLVRTQTIHWRPALMAGVGIAAIVALLEANSFPGELTQYETDVPFASFFTSILVKIVISSIIYGAGYALAFAIGHAAFRLLNPGVSLLSIYHSVFRPTRDLVRDARILWFDGALAAYMALALWAAMYQLSVLSEVAFAPELLTAPLGFIGSLSTSFSPVLAKAIDAFMIGFLFVVMAPVVKGVYLKYIRSFKNYFVCSLIFILIITSTTKYWQSYVLECVYYMAFMIGAYFWMKYCARNNPVAYFLCGALSTIGVSICGIYAYAGNVFPVDLSVLMTIFFMPLLAPFLVGTLGGYRKSSTPVKERSPVDNV